MLVLFLVKSILADVIWEVPTEMVILMGMSQASYLGPMLYKGPKDSSDD